MLLVWRWVFPYQMKQMIGIASRAVYGAARLQSVVGQGSETRSKCNWVTLAERGRKCELGYHVYAGLKSLASSS